MWLLRLQFGRGNGRSGSCGSFCFGRFEFTDKFGRQLYLFCGEVFNGDEVICRLGQNRAFVRYDILHGFFSFHFFSFRLGSVFGALASKFNSGSATFGVSVAWGAAVSSFTLRGVPVCVWVRRLLWLAPALQLLWSVLGVLPQFWVVLSQPVLPLFLALVRSPFLLAENTLSAPSFFTVFTVTRERFCFSPLRSSFSLSAATFLVAPAIACSSSIL